MALALTLLTVLVETRLVVFAVAVMISAWVGGWKPGLLATLVAVLGDAWLTLLPRLHDPAAVRGEAVHLLLFLVMALLICWFNAALRSAQEGLERSEANFRSLVINAPYGICRCAPDGTLLEANPELAAMLGFESTAELQGRNLLSEIYVVDDQRDSLAETLRGGRQFSDIEAEWKGRDGRRIAVRLSGRPIRDEQDTLTFESFAEDITERRGLEQQLRSSQKMEAIGRLAGGIAHDFNNLLMVISGYCEFLLERVGSNGELRGPAEEIQHAADRATALTRQLLAFSRRQLLDPKVLDLNDLITEHLKMLPRLIGEDIELITVPGPNLGRVKADPGQIEQVILNLIVNARDAMPDGGRLTIETANADLDEAYARKHPSVEPGRYVMLAITDTGTGMDAETQSHIFEPFFTTKGQKGTGLGLSTVYGIVKQSGGSIWVYSEPGHGSTFKVYLPRTEQVDEPARPPVSSVFSPPGRETVLLVEDELNVRTLTREFLQGQGYSVLEAADPTRALQTAIEYPGTIHLLLSDVIMPSMNGQELAQKITLLRPGTAVLYMSGYTEHAISHNGTLEEGASFLQKPFTFEALSRKVREALEERAMAKSMKVPTAEAPEFRDEQGWPKRAQRFSLNIPVHYRLVGQHQWLEGKTENISRSGVLFRAPSPVQPAALLEIALTLPNEIFGLSATDVLCRAEVVRTVAPPEERDVVPAMAPPGERDVVPAMAARFLNYQFHRKHIADA
jgi:PAS domain S-box-containing protein